MASPNTLLGYLTQENAVPETKESSTVDIKFSSKNTTHHSYPVPSAIKRWKEFKIDTIRRLFGREVDNVLMRQYDALKTYPEPPKNSQPIDHETKLTDFFKESTRLVVSEGLRISAKPLISQDVRMELGKEGKLVYGPTFKPDWAGLSDIQSTNNILPGDTKVSWKWKSKDLGKILAAGKVNRPVNKLWPIRQLLHYCICSHARYGYIITDEELVVMRVGIKENSQRRGSEEELRACVHDRALVELKAIPRGVSGGENLTVNLALWALHILAANNGLLDWEYGKLAEEKVVAPDPKRILREENLSFTQESSVHDIDERRSHRSDTEEDILPTLSFDNRSRAALSFNSNTSQASDKGSKRKRSASRLRPRKKTR